MNPNWSKALSPALLTVVCAVTLLSWAGKTGPGSAATQTTANPNHPADELVGLWKAKRRFGPDAHGPLVIQKDQSGWTADFLGQTIPLRVDGPYLSFALADGQGAFKVRVREGKDTITGYWIPPHSVVHGFRFASPVILKAEGPNRWRGSVVPREDDFTLYLMVQKRPDGSVGAFLRNPERNIGTLYDVDHITRDGNIVKLIGKYGQASSESVLSSGEYSPAEKRLSLVFSGRGGTYDFLPDSDEQSSFYPREKHPSRYVYRPPLAREDGWPTGTLEEVGIDRASIEKFIQLIIDMPIVSVHTDEPEAILVGRHGKLVLEEYFHGFNRDKLHDTRSAAKSLTATVIGAAIQNGAPLKLSSPVYEVMNGGSFPPDLDPRKRAMTLADLLMMRAGYYCNDSDPDAPGNEETILEEKEDPDFYRYSLKVPMASQPDTESIYCSMMPNIALGVVGRAAGESALDIFDRLVAKPLQWGRYAWLMDPAGNPYGGGSVQLLPRDFLKVGQVMLNRGTWQDRRILGADFVTKASAPLHDLNMIQYGYLWWSINYPYKDRTVRAYFAGGNGGQGIMVVPDLDLVIGIFAGNYSDHVGLHIQQDYPPNYILPAVREPGDDPNAPVVWRNFATPYAHPPVVKPK